jgi:MFS family permease
MENSIDNFNNPNIDNKHKQSIISIVSSKSKQSNDINNAHNHNLNLDKKIISCNSLQDLNFTTLNEEDKELVQEYIKQNRYITMEYFYRFIIIILHSITNFVVGMAWVTFAAVSSDYTTNFGVSNVLNSLNTNSYALAYVLFNFPSCYVIEKKSIYLSVSISSMFLVLGSFIKTWSIYSVAFSFIGQMFCAIAQPFIFNSNTKIVATWFRSERRLIATCFLFSVNGLGIVLGFYLPLLVFSKNISVEEWKNQFSDYIRVPCYIAAIGGLLNILLFREKPDIPPSVTSLLKNNEKELAQEKEGDLEDEVNQDNNLRKSNELNVETNNYSVNLINKNSNDQNNSNQVEDQIQEKELKVVNTTVPSGILSDTILLLKNSNFNYLLIFFSIIVGFFTFFNALFNDFLNAYQFSADDANRYSAASNFSAIPGNIIFVLLGSKIKKFKVFLIVANIVFIVLFVILTIVLELGVTNPAVYYTLYCGIGGVNSAGYIVSLDFACELTYPIDESMSTGVLFVASQLLGYLLSAPFSLLISYKPLIYELITILLLVVSLVASCLIKGT